VQYIQSFHYQYEYHGFLIGTNAVKGEIKLRKLKAAPAITRRGLVR
jgi:hypothetical protein